MVRVCVGGGVTVLVAVVPALSGAEAHETNSKAEAVTINDSARSFPYRTVLFLRKLVWVFGNIERSVL
jgi:hypothetical protein